MFDSYIIKTGDSLDSLSRKYNVSKDYLIDINNMYYIDDFREGKEIIVPNNDTYFNTYKIEKGDTLYAIARKYNINPELLITLNGLNKDDYIYPNQEIMVPKNNYSYYITAKGDTLNTVKELFNAPYEKLNKYNQSIYLLPDQLIVMKKENMNGK